uniref:Uncharacterized protein n=1 Tax=Octactis speculum TaxID=3111310 RepID=A0A7S2HF46_9STRA|mmetsp:Transcript_64333/g.88360  ORF Transcript_64333/g.88360 Transcript_64333/m.88360 type:complete len:208 (+) Transcript_64333:369-992(+)
MVRMAIKVKIIIAVETTTITHVAPHRLVGRREQQEEGCLSRSGNPDLITKGNRQIGSQWLEEKRDRHAPPDHNFNDAGHVTQLVERRWARFEHVLEAGVACLKLDDHLSDPSLVGLILGHHAVTIVFDAAGVVLKERHSGNDRLLKAKEPNTVVDNRKGCNLSGDGRAEISSSAAKPLGETASIDPHRRAPQETCRAVSPAERGSTC